MNSLSRKEIPVKKYHEKYILSDVRDHLSYNKETGHFTWLTFRRKVKPGDLAGTKDKDGYLVITYRGVLFKAHRLAWFFENGSLPAETIDHINRDRSDNRIDNLRIATRHEQSQNMGEYKNNKSGYQGVYFNSKAGKWQAQITYKGKRYHVGIFDNPEEASSARCRFKNSLSGSTKR